jgi:hypothetical protein
MFGIICFSPETAGTDRAHRTPFSATSADPKLRRERLLRRTPVLTLLARCWLATGLPACQWVAFYRGHASDPLIGDDKKNIPDASATVAAPHANC